MYNPYNPYNSFLQYQQQLNDMKYNYLSSPFSQSHSQNPSSPTRSPSYSHSHSHCLTLPRQLRMDNNNNIGMDMKSDNKNNTGNCNDKNIEIDNDNDNDSWKSKLVKNKRSSKHLGYQPFNQIMMSNMNKRCNRGLGVHNELNGKIPASSSSSLSLPVPESLPVSNAFNKMFGKSTVFCANCGGFGHIYKNCNFPITSYGIICYRLRTDQKTQCVYPEYLMVQRKDSLNFVEFIRGKYNLEKRKYILKMFSNMTEDERQEIKNNDFPAIWMKLWKVNHCHHFESEYKDSKSKFDQIKSGYLLDTETESGIIRFDLNYILENTISTIDESEWGFPKGKRNINEQDMNCAVREFAEETSMRLKYLKLQNMKPVEEVFTGTNKVRYKHVYYLATCTNNNDKFVFHSNIHGKVIDINEIKSVCWFRFSESLNLIREQNVERRELFKRVNQLVLKNICLV